MKERKVEKERKKERGKERGKQTIVLNVRKS